MSRTFPVEYPLPHASFAFVDGVSAFEVAPIDPACAGKEAEAAAEIKRARAPLDDLPTMRRL
jgi:hypothetical protein